MGDYLLTDIPDKFHRSWKTYASILGLTMKAFCLSALEEKIDGLKEEAEDEREHSGPDRR